MPRSRTLLVLAISLLWLTLNASPSHGRSDRVKGAQPYHSAAETVNLFEAIKQGTLSVKVIPRDSKQCRLFITNEADREVNVQMPAALAAVPVLAQLFPNDPAPAQNSSSVPQRVGIGNPFGQQNPMQMGPNMQGGPMMNPGNQPFFAPFCIAPEKVAQLRLPTVCLDYGHPDPRPAMRYRLVPITEVGEPKELELLCRRLGYDPESQRVAQAAAWHYCDEKSWEELQGIVVRRLARPDQSFFSSDEIKNAKLLAVSLEAAARPTGKRGESSVASTR